MITKLLAKIKKTGDIIEVIKNRKGTFTHLNSQNKTREYTKQELIFIG